MKEEIEQKKEQAKLMADLGEFQVPEHLKAKPTDTDKVRE